MKFEYKALTKVGEEVQGTIDADSGEMAILLLLQKQLYPAEVKTLTKYAEITYKKLDHLHTLKDKLEKHIASKKKAATPTIELQPVVTQAPRDWTYVIYVIAIASLILIALKYGS